VPAIVTGIAKDIEMTSAVLTGIVNPNSVCGSTYFNYGTVADFPGALRRQATVATSALLKPYTQYGTVLQPFTDLGQFSNQSVQIRAQRSFASGFSFMFSYAHVVADFQTFYDDQDLYDQRLINVADPNPHHRVVGVGSFAIPVGRGQAFGSSMPRALDLAVGGWQISGIYTYRQGSLLQFGGMVAPQSVNKTGGTGSSQFWFDTTGFGRLQPFTRRSNPLYYDDLRGPSFLNLDAVLSKRFKVHERVTPEFRLEAYNAFNQLNWANPQVNIAASDFGRTNAPVGGNLGRQLRFALRVEF